MQLVTFKLQEDILKSIDKLLKPMHFNNRTEFIRDAIRDKLEKIENEIFAKKLKKFQGSLRPKTNKTDEQIREEVGRAYAKEHGIKLD